MTILFLIALFFCPMWANSQGTPSIVGLFHIERNKNKNQVHYAIRLDHSCQPTSERPVYAYWLNLERKKGQTSPIKWFEKIAYGVKEQTKVHPNLLRITLESLPSKEIYIELSRNKKTKRCEAIARTKIVNLKATLDKVYVFARKRFLIPKVLYIDILGKLPDGSPVKERILP